MWIGFEILAWILGGAVVLYLIMRMFSGEDGDSSGNIDSE